MGRYIAIFLVLLISVLFLLPSVLGARVYGSIYDSELNTVSAVVVEVNTTPIQRHVSKYGGYSFDLPPGQYEMSATLTINGTSKEIAKETVKVISEGGEYIVDLFVFPDVDLERDFSSPSVDFQFYLLFGTAFLAVLALFILALVYFKKNPRNQVMSTHTSEVESTPVEYNVQFDSSASVEKAEHLLAEQPVNPAVEIADSDEDGQLKKRILLLIADKDGQMTQKDIRRNIDLSEAKISQVLSDLTSENKIKKVKKGRSNVIVLV